MMGYTFEASGGFHYRAYSSVDITDGKTGRDRVVPFRDKLTPVLRSWWEMNGRPETGLVFPNRDGNPVSMNTLADRVIRRTVTGQASAGMALGSMLCAGDMAVSSCKQGGRARKAVYPASEFI